MRICWDNLEKIRYSKKTKKFYSLDGKITYIYKESCENCGEPFLHSKYNKKPHRFCSTFCGKTGKNHPQYGKKLSAETRKKMGNSQKGKGIGRKKVYFDTYHKRLYADITRKSPKNEKILEVKCAYCGKWHKPTSNQVNKRVRFLEGKELRGEHRFYCSRECKKECPLFGKRPDTLMKEDRIRSGNIDIELNREAQPELRQMVFDRDNYTCQKCGSTKSLHCHHIEGIRWEPLESADMDRCITLCKKCHKKVHKIPDCGYHDLKCIRY